MKEIGLRLTLRRVKDGFSSIQFEQDIRNTEMANRKNILKLILTFLDLIVVNVNLLFIGLS